MLNDAGFGDVTVHGAPGDPGNAVFVATKGGVTSGQPSTDPEK